MSRGRPPRLACTEACARAAQRGMVLDADRVAVSRFDFMLFTRERVTFVRVKRSHSRISAVNELTVRFSSEIAGLRKVPQTPVVSRELWILLPWGAWQYYGIGDETVTGIDEDTGKNSGPPRDPVLVPDLRDTMSAGTGIPGAGPPGPAPLSPYAP